MNKLYIDCNILLDWFTNREPHAFPAIQLLIEIEKKKYAGYVSPLTLSNTFYLLQKEYNKAIAYRFLKDAHRLFEIVDIKKNHVIKAIDEKYKDFEDDLHYMVARENKMTHIITRNKNDFRTSEKILIQTAEEYMKEQQ
jgi:predicted nucleic acid-binding protein